MTDDITAAGLPGKRQNGGVSGRSELKLSLAPFILRFGNLSKHAAALLNEAQFLMEETN
jgi:hypothetical protein